MSKWFQVMFAAVLLQACGASPESTEVEQEALQAGPGAPGALVCCREKFPAGARRGLCVAQAARGQGPCASGHHPGGGGRPPCKDAGGAKDAAVDAGHDAAVDAAQDAGNHCPSLVSISAVPEPTPAAAKFNLAAVIADNGALDAITFDWRVVGASVGWLEDFQSTPNATFVCGSLGTQTLEMTMTGGDFSTTCVRSATLAIECTTVCGNGIVDPGESCDPPDGVNCDATCNSLNHCPVVTSVVPSYVSVAQGDTVTVTVTASDPNPTDTLSYIWNPTQWGAVSGDTGSPSVTYSCNLLGPLQLNVTVSDGKCSTVKGIPVACIPKCGNGIVESGEQCDPPRTGPYGLQCGPTCRYLTCGNGKNRSRRAVRPAEGRLLQRELSKHTLRQPVVECGRTVRPTARRRLLLDLPGCFAPIDHLRQRGDRSRGGLRPARRIRSATGAARPSQSSAETESCRPARAVTSVRPVRSSAGIARRQTVAAASSPWAGERAFAAASTSWTPRPAMPWSPAL